MGAEGPLPLSCEQAFAFYLAAFPGCTGQVVGIHALFGGQTLKGVFAFQLKQAKPWQSKAQLRQPQPQPLSTANITSATGTSACT